MNSKSSAVLLALVVFLALLSIVHAGDTVWISPRGTDNTTCGATAADDSACATLEYSLMQRQATTIKAVSGIYYVDTELIQKFEPKVGQDFVISGADGADVRFVALARTNYSTPLLRFSQGNCPYSVTIQNAHFVDFQDIVSMSFCKSLDVQLELSRVQISGQQARTSALHVVNPGSTTKIILSQVVFFDSMGSLLTVSQSHDMILTLSDSVIRNNNASSSLISLEATDGASIFHAFVSNCNFTNNFAEWTSADIPTEDTVQPDGSRNGVVMTFLPAKAAQVQFTVSNCLFEHNMLTIVGASEQTVPTYMSSNIVIIDPVGAERSHLFKFEGCRFWDNSVLGTLGFASTSICTKIGQDADSLNKPPEVTFDIENVAVMSSFLWFNLKAVIGDMYAALSAGPVFDIRAAQMSLNIRGSIFEKNIVNDTVFENDSTRAFLTTSVAISLQGQFRSDVQIRVEESRFLDNVASCSAQSVQCFGALGIKSTSSPNINLDFQLFHSTFIANRAKQLARADPVGGALALDVSCTSATMIASSTFIGNEADSDGGSIFVNTPFSASKFALYDSSVQNSRSKNGHGGCLYAAFASTTIDGTQFGNCSAPVGFGGACHFLNTAQFDSTRNSFEHCTAQRGGGAIYLGSTARSTGTSVKATIVSSSFFDSTATNGDGGAIMITDVSVTLSFVTATNSRAVRGGAIAIFAQGVWNHEDKTTNIGQGTFSGCRAQEQGGCLFVGDSAAKLTIYGSTLSDGEALGDGGFLYSISKESDVLATKFFRGKSGTSGGCVLAVSLNTHGSRFNACSAAQHGGAIFIQDRGNLRSYLDFFDSCTAVAGNAGAIGCSASTMCNIYYPNVAGCSAPNGYGGGILCASSLCLITFITMNNNTAMHGGHIALIDALSTGYGLVSVGSATDGTATENGGAFFIERPRGVEPVISAITFERNRAAYGGSIAIFGAPTMPWSRQPGYKFVDSTATHAGGVIFASTDSLFRCNFTELEPFVTNAISESGFGHICATEPTKVVLSNYTSDAARVPSGSSLSQVAVSVLDDYDQPVSLLPSSTSYHQKPVLILAAADPQLVLLQTREINFTDGLNIPLNSAQVYGHLETLASHSQVDTSINMYLVLEGKISTACTSNVSIPVSVTRCAANQAAFSLPGSFQDCRPSRCPQLNFFQNYRNASNYLSLLLLVSVVIFIGLSGALCLRIVVQRLLGYSSLWGYKLSLLSSSVTVTVMILSQTPIESLLLLILSSPGQDSLWQQESFGEYFQKSAALIFPLGLIAHFCLVSVFLWYSSSAIVVSSLLSRPLFKFGQRTCMPYLQTGHIFVIILALLTLACVVTSFSLEITAMVLAPRSAGFTSVSHIFYTIRMAFTVLSATLSILLCAIPAMVYTARAISTRAWLLSPGTAQDFELHQSNITLLSTTRLLLKRSYDFVMRCFGPLLMVLWCVLLAVLALVSTQEAQLSCFGLTYPILCSSIVLLSLPVPLVIMNIRKLPEPAKQLSSKNGDDGYQNMQELTPAALMRTIPEHLVISADHLKFIREIGSGAQGVVFYGEFNSAAVAIKARQTKFAFGDLEQLFSEFRVLSTLQHPNIVRLLGLSYDEEKSRLSLVMEYCGGGSLASLLDRCRHERRETGQQKLLPFAHKLRLLYGTALGIGHIHKKGLIHRDVKAENVLLDDTSLQAKVADFGYARQFSVNQQMTMAAGTAVYLSPEAVRAAGGDGAVELPEVNSPGSSLTRPILSDGSSLKTSTKTSSWLVQLNRLLIKDGGSSGSGQGSSVGNSTRGQARTAFYDQKADVYSFGILMFVVLTENTKPYGNMSDLDVIARQMRTGDLRPKLDGEPLVSAAVEHGHSWYIELMQQCWHKNPIERPSFETIIRSLKNYQSG